MRDIVPLTITASYKRANFLPKVIQALIGHIGQLQIDFFAQLNHLFSKTAFSSNNNKHGPYFIEGRNEIFAAARSVSLLFCSDLPSGVSGNKVALVGTNYKNV